jgi:hypothetical protein
MRVIIRFSLNRDTNSKMRNDLKAILESYGIMWTGGTGKHKTATYEGTGLSEKRVQQAVLKFWGRVQTLSAVHIDHFWMYADAEPIDQARKKLARMQALSSSSTKHTK